MTPEHEEDHKPILTEEQMDEAVTRGLDVLKMVYGGTRLLASKTAEFLSRMREYPTTNPLDRDN